MSDFCPAPVCSTAIEFEKNSALNDARDMIRERGQAIKIHFHYETGITRDKFNSIKKRSQAAAPAVTMYAFPVIYNPTTKQLDAAGIKEKTEVLIKIAVLDWVDAGYSVATLKDLDSIRASVIIAGAKYEISSKQLDSQYADTFLYIHIGCNRI